MTNNIKPEWNKQRETVFLDRYALTDEEGNTLEEKPEEMWERIDNELEGNYYDELKDFKFVPAGRQLNGIGNPGDVSFFNCFVVPFHNKQTPNENLDSRQAIMDTISTAVEITARGGGVGFNWSVLRPKDSYIKGVNGHSSGTVSWMKAMNGVIDQVEQGGSRRGAQMYLLEDWHPDIIDFIEVKEDLNTLNGANLSVGVSDDFMKAVKNDEEWVLKFPDTSFEKYDKEWDGNIKKWEEKGYPVEIYDKLPAKEIWDKICQYAWETAEPGVIFLERYNKWSNTNNIERIITTNPCGEQGLGEWGVCNLGAINLVHFIDKNGNVKYDELEKHVRKGVRFLDEVIDKNNYTMPQIKEKQEKIRRIGLGTMGLADALILAGVKYGTEESLNWIDDVYSFIRNKAYDESVELAKEKGTAPSFDKKEFANKYFIKKLPDELQDKIYENGIRNLSILTQAPTGSTGMLSGVSSGIEPNFSWSYIRKDSLGERTVKHWIIEQENYDLNDLPDYFVTSMDLTPEDHVRVQGKIQEFLDTSISKTVNAPQEHTIEDVKELYIKSYDLGCKGTTYYRNGTRTGVLVTDDDDENKNENENDDTNNDVIIPEERPEVTDGTTIKVDTGCGKIYLTLNFDKEGNPIETFVNAGSKGGCSILYQGLSRMISLSLRSGVPVEEVIDQLKSVDSCPSCLYKTGKGEDVDGSSCPDIIGKALEDVTDVEVAVDNGDGMKCPECGEETLYMVEGCQTCSSCGFSKCG